jgi:hypothetical protein
LFDPAASCSFDPWPGVAILLLLLRRLAGLLRIILFSIPEQRDLSLSSTAPDHALSAIMIHASAVSTPMIAVTANRLRAQLTQAGERTSVLADAERLLLSEWLLRLTEQGD